MRRLGALLSSILIGTILLSISTFLTTQMVESGRNLYGPLLGVVGMAASVAAMVWIAFLEGIFAGLDAKKLSQALIILAASAPLMGTASFATSGRLGQAFLVGGVLAMSWCASRMISAFQGPPPPEHLPTELVHEHRGLTKPPRLAGILAGVPVAIEYSNAWNGERFESRRVECSLPEGGKEVSMVPASLIGRLSGSIEKTGDAAFDGLVHVRGPRPLVLALLRSPARAAVRDVVAAGGSIEDGAAKADGRVVLPLLVQAASALSITGSIYDALETNAFADPDAGVRLATIEVLLTLEGIDARRAALTACRKALQDGDPRLRVLGIAALRDAGSPAERDDATAALAEIPRPGAVIAELLDRDPAAGTATALLRLLDDPRCGAEAAPAVERLLRRTTNEGLRELAASALETLRKRADEGRGQVSLSIPDSAAGALSQADGAGNLSHPKKQQT